MKKRLLFWIVLAAALCGAFWLYNVIANRKPYDPEKFVMGNGRIEATEVTISAKLAGRIERIYIEEGQLVTNGQKLVEIQTDELRADLLKAKASLAEAEAKVKEAEITISLKQAEAEAARGTVAEKKSVVRGAENKEKRYKAAAAGAIPVTDVEDLEATIQMYKAQLASAEASAKKAEVDVESAKSRLEVAKAVVEAQKAAIKRIEVDIKDSTIVAKHDGRIQYRIAQLGEMVGSGAGILNLVDLTDVYMTLFIPEKLIGSIAQGAECRIVLDAAKDWPIRANISYVSSVAQFTPKTVETEVEREKLMFRVRARIPAENLRKYIEYARTGLPGVAYVRLDPNAEWPEFLQARDN